MFKSLMPRNNALGIVEFCDEKFLQNIIFYSIIDLVFHLLLIQKINSKIKFQYSKNQDKNNTLN